MALYLGFTGFWADFSPKGTKIPSPLWKNQGEVGEKSRREGGEEDVSRAGDMCLPHGDLTFFPRRFYGCVGEVLTEGGYSGQGPPRTGFGNTERK